jgi:anti-sigma-K factor RskA
MLSLNRRVLSLIAMNLSLAAAQQSGPLLPAPKPDVPVADSGAVFHSDTRVVVCPTTVVDKAGHLVTDLPKSAFQVYENKDLQNFTIKREDVPVSLGLIIDNSGSMKLRRSIWCWRLTGKMRLSW